MSDPLKNLLRTEERKQADAFRREVSLRSFVNRGGDWRTATPQTLKAAQTNMGKLAASLSSVSSLLSEYTNYQMQKEQEALKQEGLQAAIEGEAISRQKVGEQIAQAGIQNQQIAERILQQELKTNEINTQRQDAEWDSWWSSLGEENQKLYREQARQEAEELQIGIKNAERKVDNAVGPAARHEHPLGEIRAMRRMGAGLYPDYVGFIKKREQEIKDGLSEGGLSTVLTREQAEEAAKGLLTEYLESKQLNPESEMGKGFMSSVSQFNSVAMPELVAAFLKESEAQQDKQTANALLKRPTTLAAPLPGPSVESVAYSGVDSSATTIENTNAYLDSLSPSQRQRVARILSDEEISLDNLYDEYTYRRALEVADFVKNPPETVSIPIEESAVFKELQAMRSDSILRIIGGNPAAMNKGGLIKAASADEKEGKRFALTLQELGETLRVDGVLFKDHTNFLTYVTNLEDAIERAKERKMVLKERRQTAFNKEQEKSARSLVARQPNDNALLTVAAALTEHQVPGTLDVDATGNTPEEVQATEEAFLDYVVEQFPDLEEELRSLPEEERLEAYGTLADTLMSLKGKRRQVRIEMLEEQSWFTKQSDPSVLFEIVNGYAHEEDFEGRESARKALEEGRGGEGWNAITTRAISDEKGTLQEGLSVLVVEYEKDIENVIPDTPLSADYPQELRQALIDINTEFKEKIRRHFIGQQKEAEIEESGAEQLTKEAQKTLSYTDIPRKEMPVYPYTQGLKETQEEAKKRSESMGGFGGLLNGIFNFMPKDFSEDSSFPTRLRRFTKEVDAGTDVAGRRLTKRVWKTEDELGSINIPDATIALKTAKFTKDSDTGPGLGKRERSVYLNVWAEVEASAKARVDVFAKPGGSFRAALTEYADKASASVPFFGRTEKFAEHYNFMLGLFQQEVRDANALSVEPSVLADLVKTRETLESNDALKDRPFVAYDADYFFNQEDSKHSDRDIKDTRTWQETRKPVTLESNHFEANKPVITGLPEKDRSLKNVISVTGISAKQWVSIAEAYGYSSPQRLLEEQYKHPYYEAFSN